MAAARHSESGGKPRTVAVLLPHREIYSAVGAGAVSICVRDICAASAWRDRTVVFGAPVEAPFEGVAFQPVQSASWVHGSRTSRYLAGAVRQFRRLQPAVIEVHNRPQYIGPLRRKLPRVPLLLYLHNDPRLMKGLATPAERARLLDRVAAVVCVSDYIRRCMLDGLQAHSGCDKVHANLNGIDTGRFAPPADHDKRPEVLFVGRLTPDKGALLFAEAVHKALPQLAGWRAVLVGSRWFRDAPRVTDFEREVTGHLEALGAQGEIAGYLTHEQVMARFRDARHRCGAIPVGRALLAHRHRGHGQRLRVDRHRPRRPAGSGGGRGRDPAAGRRCGPRR